MRISGLKAIVLAIAGAALACGALTSCGEVDDNVSCNTAMDCDKGFICTKELNEAQGVCKLRRGEPCYRPAECSTGLCTNGFCP